MAKCDVTVSLDRAEPVYRPTETVSGTVDVRTNTRCQCQQLTVSLNWRTAGKGNQVTGEPVVQRLGDHDWQAGQSQQFDFELAAPDGPLSYDGEVLRIEWFAQARVDVDWAADPKSEPVGLSLLRWSSEDVLAQGANYREGPRHYDGEYCQGPTVKQGNKVFEPATAAGCGGVALAVGGLCIATLSEAGINLGVAALIVALMLLFYAIPKLLARSRVGEPQVQIEPEIVRPGEAVHVQLALDPRRKVRLNEITSKLRGREVVVRGSGKNSKTSTHELHEKAKTLVAEKVLKSGQKHTFETDFTIPENAPPSFGAPGNELVWQIELHVDIAGWPDWKQQRRIVVQPAPVDRS